MINNNFPQDGFDPSDNGFIPSDFAGFLPPSMDPFSGDMFNRDFTPFPMINDFETLDPANFMQIFDQAYQYFPEEMKQFIPYGFEYPMPTPESFDPQVLKFAPKTAGPGSKTKIGTLTIEERRMKVQKYLEKRKRRNFNKKISYMCRKKVADQWVRVKGRFVSKVQADAMLGDKSEKLEPAE
jgi:hypothetical protein